ncbi:MAG: hypothetical protein V5A56_12550 [Halolamina sp.]
MTDNHDYNTPREGSTNWHIPLNENFRRIDRDVEVRDVEANRGQYQPNSNAKFLATDTGRVYIGDGQGWQRIGSITNGRTGIRWATSGNLQTKLNEAQAESGNPSAVACEPGVVFDDTPYTIPENTTLMCNGVRFEATRDTDILLPEAGSRIVGPARFDSQSPTYSSSHINIDAGETRSSPISMRGGHDIALSGVFRHEGTEGEGNAVRVKGATNPDSANHNVTQNYLGRHYVYNIGDALLADADGGFLNDNHIWIEASDCTNFWHHKGTHEAKFLIHGHLQTGNIDRGFYNETGRKSCRFWGHLEDPHRTPVMNVEGDAMKIYCSTRANFSRQHWNLGAGTTVNGVGYETADQEEPPNTPLYHPGEMVIFNDSGDRSGSGLYMKSPWEGVTPWIRLADGTFM